MSSFLMISNKLKNLTNISCKPWQAVYTRPNNEKKVVHFLKAKGFTHYCPMNKIATKSIMLTEKTVHKPLFPSIIFFKASLDELPKIRQFPGVNNLLYWLDQPAVFPNNEIEMIQAFLQKYEKVQVELININPDKIGKVKFETQINYGIPAMLTDCKTVKLEIPSLGYNLYGINRTISMDVNKNISQKKFYR